MKKLMVVMSMIVAASLANAASIYWQVGDSAWTLQDGSMPAAGTSVWLIDNAQSASIIAALKNKAVIDFSRDTWEDSVTALTGVFDVNMTAGAFGRVDEKLATSSAIEHYEISSKTYNFAALFVDTESLTDGNIYYAITQPTESIGWDKSINPDGEYENLNYDGTAFSSGTGWQIAQQVPEPTSGLLMLIGMAGLALRRRRA